MTEQTTIESELTEDTDDVSFDAERDIIEYDRDDLDADDLYDVRQEAEELDAVALAARIEIERRNYLAHDTYRVQFAQHELVDVGMILMSAKQRRFETNEKDRVHRIQELAASFLDGLEIDEMPTLDEHSLDEVKDE